MKAYIKKNNKNTGITLIALVITIIILLILAGVTIASLIESGLFMKAKQAKEKSENSQNLENEILSSYENIIDNMANNDNYAVGEEIDSKLLSNYDSNWHICDGTTLKKEDYPILAQKRSDLLTKKEIDHTPVFTSENSRVQSSGCANEYWPAYVVFSPETVNYGAGWVSQHEGEKWISIDMEENTTINKMEITNVNYNNQLDYVGAPIDFSIKGSFDNSKWDEIVNITGNEYVNPGEVHSYTFSKVSYRYYKIDITEGVKWWNGNSYYGFRFWKLIEEEDMIKLPNNPEKIIKIQ